MFEGGLELLELGSPFMGFRYEFTEGRAQFLGQLADHRWTLGAHTVAYGFTDPSGTTRILVGVADDDGWISTSDELPRSIEAQSGAWGLKLIRRTSLEGLATHGPGEWVPVLQNMPVERHGNTISVDWSACSSSQPCRDLQFASGNEVLSLENDGLVLRVVGTKEAYFKRVSP